LIDETTVGLNERRASSLVTALSFVEAGELRIRLKESLVTKSGFPGFLPA
jgi:hypothetical protein